MSKYIVEKENDGKRLDEVLFSLGAASSRSKVQTLIKDGLVTVNDKTVKPHFWLKEGDVVEYTLDLRNQTTELKPEYFEIPIVYEDDDVIVIDKPAGLVVHPGNGHQEGTLVNALIGRDMKLGRAKDPIRPGLVHRIDKDTSGLLVIAKNDESLDYLSAQLSDHSMHREYLALVKGIIYEDEGKIDAPIGRDKMHPLKNCVDVRDGKESVTFFKVIKRYRDSDCTLISCRLKTGRTHQIRVHMEYIDHPVIGDPLYGSGNRKIYDKGQLLHAYRITFKHPKTHKEVSFEAPLPKHFQDVLDTLLQ
ncbi:MAG: RluA family pseudouridine synthase [Bacilli bacterium]|nr:RluA family pseudouridine synthase [Bacilli bacterium]